MGMRVIKIGGNEIERPAFTGKLAAVLKRLNEPLVIVHGGGKAIDELQLQLGIQPVKVGGMRVTDEASLQAALMSLCGAVSKRLVASLVSEGVDAVGLCGVDGGLMRVSKLIHPKVDLGYVGRIETVRVGLLLALIEQGIVPVVAPLSLGPNGMIFNVNADDAACALALAMGARLLDYVSNVPGVIVNGSPTSLLRSSEAEMLIASGEIKDGMVPKVRAALKAIHQGVPQVRIVDIEGFNQTGGTVIVSDETPTIEKS
jgi:acetylglutamate kinase